LPALALSAVIALSPAVASGQQATPEAPVSIGEPRVIGVQALLNDLVVDGTLVGGLSGIDYHAASDRWVVISDDRSEHAPARIYTMDLEYTAESFSSVTLQGVVTLQQPNGEPYPDAAAGGTVPDTESVRIDPVSGLVWYANEGTANRGIDPFLAVSTWDGELVAQTELPEMFEVDSGGTTGPLEGYGVEGMSFAADGESIWVSLEGPLYQDGPPATVDHGAVTRITQLDRSGAMLAQFAYELEPIPAPAPAFFDTGVSEILVIDETRFLTLERTTVERADGVFDNFISIYEIDTAAATDVKAREWLSEGTYAPVSKRLVLDVSAVVGVDAIDNVEGITWGLVLENGNHSLVLVSDNNFNDSQVTQFIAIEVPT
jgi:hypothetical protein